MIDCPTFMLWGTRVGTVGAVAFGVWNRFGIKDISIKVDGLLIKYIKAEKDKSYLDGVHDGQIAVNSEHPDSPCGV